MTCIQFLYGEKKYMHKGEDRMKYSGIGIEDTYARI
jgi:hypothetical protein